MQRHFLRTLSAWTAAVLTLVIGLPASAQERAMVPVTVDGETVKLATITHKPSGAGPFPTLIFHHGSTGRGTDPALFANPYEPIFLIDWFVARGWAVILPSRRGRGGSEGLYDEGFYPDRTKGYACDDSISVAGADRALRDIDAVTAVLLAQPFVDRNRFIVGGQSRGGILSVAWSGRHPDQPKAVIDFVGGWLGAGCPFSATVNALLFKRGAIYPQATLWLYGDSDSFYPLAHSHKSFDAFTAAGGKGTFHEFKPPAGTNGHFIGSMPTLWSRTVESYLAERGLPAKIQGLGRLADDQIKAAVVGKKIEWRGGGVGDYGADGSYAFTLGNSRSTGRYSIAGGQLCVDFTDGSKRCDTIGKDDRGLFMNTAGGAIYYAVP